MDTNNFRRLNNKFSKDIGDNIGKNFSKINKFKSLNMPDRGDANKISIANQNLEKLGVNRNINAVLARDDMVKANGVRKTKEQSKINVFSRKYDKTDQHREVELKGLDNTIKNTPKIKVPVIKTTTKNETKSYDVTSTEPKQMKTLKINIPNVNQKKTKIPKLIKNNKNFSITNIKFRQKNRVSSPVLTKKASPETEVAKWGPSNKHSKCYYDAWLNFEAISKNFKSKVERENYLKLQRELARRESPELIHKNFADESFTGRIKVNHR